MYGFGAEVRYKNWTLNVLFKGTGNNYFLYGDKDSSKFDGYIPFNGGYKGNVLALAYNPANRWTSADYSGNRATENPNARFPRLSYGNNANNTKPSTFWKGNARYLRLQELSLNYNLHTPGCAKRSACNPSTSRSCARTSRYGTAWRFSTLSRPCRPGTPTRSRAASRCRFT